MHSSLLMLRLLDLSYFTGDPYFMPRLLLPGNIFTNARWIQRTLSKTIDKAVRTSEIK